MDDMYWYYDSFLGCYFVKATGHTWERDGDRQ